MESGQERTLTVYQRMLLEQLPRAMAVQDFNPRSATYGCCDRGYWQYKTLTSFPSSVYQQLALPFALAFVSDDFENPYYQDEQLLDRSVAAVKSWGRHQHRTGAVDEWYRHEFSYCPTAFTAMGMGETLLLLREQMPLRDFADCFERLSRSCNWLAKRFNPQVMNQNLAACGALWNAYQLSDDERWRRSFEEKWERTLEHLHPEGWFLEYEGADLGYTTLALDVLAALDRRGCEDGPLEVAQNVCRFMDSFVGPHGELAGRLGSRGTAHTFPFGVNYFAPHCEAAGRVAERLRRGHEAGTSLVPSSVDDRYFAYFYLPQFAQAATVDVARDFATTGSDNDSDWSESGFRVRHRARATVITSLRRQGAFNVNTPDNPVHHNLGFWVETVQGERFASCGWNAGEIDFDQSGDDDFTVRGRFNKVGDKLPLVKGAVAFTVLSEWLLSWESIAERFQKFIKQQKIVRRTTAPLKFRRQFKWQGTVLTVIDQIEKESDCRDLVAVGPVDDVDVHSPSAKFGSHSERITIEKSAVAEWAKLLNRDCLLTLRSSYAVAEQGTLKFLGIEVIDNAPATQIPSQPAAA